MEKRSLQTLLKKVRSELEWPVVEQSHQMPVVRIVSYPRNKSHVILKPEQASKQHGDAAYLHELGHAILCEKVHPVFSATTSFAPQDDKRRFLIIVPALNVACDWFVGGWQMGVAPRLTRMQIRESLPIAEEIVGQASLPPLEVILDAALVIAQGIQYLGEPIECDGVLDTAVKAFLAAAPDQPSCEACVRLVNALMSTYSHQRAFLVQKDGHWVWDVQTLTEVEIPAGDFAAPGNRAGSA